VGGTKSERMQVLVIGQVCLNSATVFSPDHSGCACAQALVLALCIHDACYHSSGCRTLLLLLLLQAAQAG
jgi:hypothetical protein